MMCARRKYCNIEKETNMTKKKKIGLLNLPVDNNFGGHLQRYALITVLQRMGYEVEHLNTRFPGSRKSLLKYVKGGFKRLLLYPYYAITKKTAIYPLRFFKYYIKHEPLTEAFYEKYIPHTVRFFSNEELAQYDNYDCYVVGSDQVWRKSIAANYGLFTYLFDYLPDDKIRIAYGASQGIDKNELTEDDIVKFRELYSRFRMVSIREQSGLDLLKSYSCDNPIPECVLDPTLLLTAQDYSNIINAGNTTPLKEKIFCYILDMNEDKITCIQDIAKTKGLDYCLWSRDKHFTVEQWLRSFRDADFVITDSYHGLLFSLVFNKNFHLFRNQFRGNARFDSIAISLGVDLDKELQDYTKINQAIIEKREQSIHFLENSIQ